MSRQPLTAEELERIIGSDDYRRYLNPRNATFRERGFADNPPPRSEAIRLMAEDNNLIRRPLLVDGHSRIFGFDEAAFKLALS